MLRPGYGWLHTARLSTTYQTVRELRDPEFVGQVDDYCRAQRFPVQMIRRGLLVLSKIMLHTGRPAAEISAADVVAYYHATWQQRRKIDGVELAWDLLQRFGGIPAEALPFREAVRSGPMPTSEMVLYYQLQCAPVADLLIRYLDERATTLDYASLRQLAYKLAGVFWQDLELHHPGIDSLDLPAEVATAWKRRCVTSRSDPWPILIAVRALYLDIAHWATHDAYWASWAARCPVGVHDTRGDGKHRKHVRARLHQRVRALTPHLPMLLRSADAQALFQAQLLAAAQQTELGATFTFHGRDYQHMPLKSTVGAGRRGTYPGTGRIWLIDLETGKRIDQTQREDFTFWGWAGLNTFYYTGMRMEELSELTSTALFTYRLPDTTEALPLLQIAPSKSDSERVLLIPPELAHVLARVKQRVRGHSGIIPLVVRYDIYERTTTAPMPFLFQRQHGTQRRVISANTLADMITQLINHAGLTGLDGQPLHLTPHDFRRVFATEAVAGGLPIHIVAKLLGHESLTTTEAYTAVYPHDVIRHYRSFITHRRSLRPSEEYRQPTSTEWEEFHQHFHKRKVELGTCGRGYGTPCQHEHACIRCPMLRPDPRPTAPARRDQNQPRTTARRSAPTRVARRGRRTRNQHHQRQRQTPPDDQPRQPRTAQHARRKKPPMSASTNYSATGQRLAQSPSVIRRKQKLHILKLRRRAPKRSHSQIQQKPTTRSPADIQRPRNKPRLPIDRGARPRAANNHTLVIHTPQPDTQPELVQRRFLSRNRIIAALGSVTVVVEAGQRSGALNTAGYARDLGRPVLAVPGPVTSAMSVGCHRLLQRDEQPAQLVTSVADILGFCSLAGMSTPTAREVDDGGQSAASEGSGAAGSYGPAGPYGPAGLDVDVASGDDSAASLQPCMARARRCEGRLMRWTRRGGQCWTASHPEARLPRRNWLG